MVTARGAMGALGTRVAMLSLALFKPLLPIRRLFWCQHGMAAALQHFAERYGIVHEFLRDRDVYAERWKV